MTDPREVDTTIGGYWPVAAIVLAAGASSRMGRPKGLLPWHDAPLATYVVRELLQTPIRQIVVVLGCDAVAVASVIPQTDRVQVVTNARWADGKAGSVAFGAGFVPKNIHLLLAAIDQPRDRSLISAVVDEHVRGADQRAGDGRSITVASYQGKRGHPIIVIPELLDEVREVTEETYGMRAVLLRHAPAVRLAETGNPDTLLNLNTPEEYTQATVVTRVSYHERDAHDLSGSQSTPRAKRKGGTRPDIGAPWGNEDVE